MTYYGIYYVQIQFIKQGLLAPTMQFKYDGLGWIGLFPEPVLQGILALIFVAGVLITIGYRMRPAAMFYAISLAYFFLVEKAYYNNHIYLFILLCLLLSFTNADRFLSIKGNKGHESVIPRWQVFILQFQIAIVYFYGGLAKLDPDWLFRQEPMRTLVTTYLDRNNEILVLFLTYGGLLLDLAAPFVLFYKPLRKWGLIPLILFHATNTQLFNDIGIFPYVMLGSLILFLILKNCLGGEIRLHQRTITLGKKKKPKGTYYQSKN
jgi:vitamin K-dependent gamma-carboxylase